MTNGPADTTEGATSEHGLRRTLGVMDLVFLNIAAIVGLRWLSTGSFFHAPDIIRWVIWDQIS